MMIANYNKRVRSSLWDKWLNETIYADSGIYKYGPRSRVFYEFVRDGLNPFVQSKGYVFNGDVKKITKAFLHFLFAMYTGENIVFQNPYKDYEKEHFFEFQHRFDSSAIEEFWKDWCSIEDFQESSYGYKVKHILDGFLWATIDLDKSPITEMIDRILYEEEMEERKDSKGKEDPYLQETSKFNYEDRHWH
jgi:hypothetical protein